MSREPTPTIRQTLWGVPSISCAARRARQSYEPDCESFTTCLRIDDTVSPHPVASSPTQPNVPASPSLPTTASPPYPLAVQSERLQRFQANSDQLLGTSPPILLDSTPSQPVHPRTFTSRFVHHIQKSCTTGLPVLPLATEPTRPHPTLPLATDPTRSTNPVSPLAMAPMRPTNPVSPLATVPLRPAPVPSHTTTSTHPLEITFQAPCPQPVGLVPSEL